MKTSCENTCLKTYIFAFGNCACHQYCELLGTCCADYFTYCKEPPLHEISKLVYTEASRNMTMQDFRNLSREDQDTLLLESHMSLQVKDKPRTSCHTVSRAGGDRVNLLLVDTCPTERFEEMCENLDNIPSASDKYALVYRDRLFSNKYCALCNGIQLNDSSVRVVNPSFQCGNSSSDAERIFRKYGHAAFEQFVMHNCTPEYDFASAMVNNYHYFTCPEFVDYVQYCNSSQSESLTNYDSVNRACNGYKSDVLAYLDSSPVVYKNQHCALCNAVYNMSALTCFSQR